MNTSSANIQPSFSSKKLQKEPVTPYKIALALFVREFCVTRQAQLDGPSNVTGEESLANFSVVKNKKICMFLLRAVKCTHTTWEDFHSLVSGKSLELPSTFIIKYVEAFKELIEKGIGGIASVAESCLTLTRSSDEQSLVGKTSVVGFFLRRLWLQLEELSFSESVMLSNALLNYFTSRNTTTVIHHHKSKDSFVYQQQQLLQKNEVKALDHPSIQSTIKALLKKMPDFPEAHYLLHANSLRVKNFTDAEHYLHHAFNQSCSIDSLTGTLPKADERVISKVYGSAVFGLALIHASVGQAKESLSALKEAIGKFEDSGDPFLLQQALAWLCKLGSKYYAQRRLKMLETLIKVNETTSQHLVSYGLLVWIQNALTKETKPSELFRYLHMSDMRNLQGPYHDLTLSGLVLRAALYHFYGFPLNACLTSQQALMLSTSDPTRVGLSFNNENTLAAFITLANHLGRSGHYDQLDGLMEHIREEYSAIHKYHHVWKTCQLHWRFYRVLWAGSLDEALQAAGQLFHLDRFDGLCKMAEAQLYRGGYHEALNVLASLNTALSSHEDRNDPKVLVCSLKLLILSAVASSALSAKEEALEKLIEASALCKRHRMFLMAVLVSLQTAALQFQMGLGSIALELIEDAMDVLWSSASLYEQGLALLLKSHCLVAAPSDDGASKKAALGLLAQAKECFEKIDAFYWVKGTVQLQMLVMHSLGDRQRRNQCALEYRQMEQCFPMSFAPNVLIFLGL